MKAVGDPGRVANKRVAVLLSREPYPLTNGVDLRFYHFLRCLTQRYEFSLYSAAGEGAQSALADLFHEQLQLPSLDPGEGAARSLRSRLDSRALYNQHPAWSDFLARELTSYDLVLTTTGWLPYLEGLRDVPVLVDVIDDAVLQYLREFRIANGLRDKLRKLYYAYLHFRFERRFCSDRVVEGAYITSEVDAEMLHRVASLTDLRVIQNGVDVDYFSPQAVIESPAEIVFEGNMSFNQNVAAAVNFCHKILPKLQQRAAGVRVTIVGKDPAPEVWALNDLSGVEVTGTVDDVRPYIARASVFVCPLLSGGGIKNKILQAWAMGKACVATSVSLGGLGAVDGGDLLVADSDSDFAEAVLRCLGDDALRRRLGARGREKVVGHYSWHSRALALSQQMDDVMASNATPVAEAPASL